MKIYKKTQSVIAGESAGWVDTGDGSRLWQSPVVRAFVDDDEIQEITIVSATSGVVITLRK